MAIIVWLRRQAVLIALLHLMRKINARFAEKCSSVALTER